MKSTITLLIALSFIIGCGSRQPMRTIVEKKPSLQTTSKKKLVTPVQSKLPKAPKKNIKLKTVQDKNYNDNYMYPEDSKAAKKDPTKQHVTNNSLSLSMTKEECISMISQEKFDRYTAMFGNEAASIKRCAMIKAMNK